MSEWRDPWIAMAPLGASVWASGVSVGRVSVSLVAGVAGNWPKIHLPNPCSLKSSSCRSGNTSCFLHRSYLGPSCCRSYFLTGSSDSDNLFNAVAFGWCWKAEKSAYSIQEHPLIASDVAHVKFLILKQPASHISFAASPSAIIITEKSPNYHHHNHHQWIVIIITPEVKKHPFFPHTTLRGTGVTSGSCHKSKGIPYASGKVQQMLQNHICHMYNNHIYINYQWKLRSMTSKKRAPLKKLTSTFGDLCEKTTLRGPGRCMSTNLPHELYEVISKSTKW